MKRTGHLVAAAVMTSLLTGGAVAVTATGSAPQTERFPKHSWERGHLIGLVQEQRAAREAAAPTPVAERDWERGEMLRQIRGQKGNETGPTAASAAPRVIIYFDESASEPGLPRSLGNTSTGRGIMLRYLQSARESSPAS